MQSVMLLKGFITEANNPLFQVLSTEEEVVRGRQEAVIQKKVTTLWF